MTEQLARPQAPWALRLVPPFPAVAQRILSLVNQPDANLNELTGLVKFDPSFAAELLRFANSALLGSRRKVRSLPLAIIVVGLDRVKTVATLVSVNRMVRHSVSKEALRKVWVHSLVTAMIAEEIARVSGVARESAYTAGLLHNLGTLGLMSAYPDEYSRMLEVSNDFGFDLLQTEQDLFEIDHTMAGAFLAHDWDFPDELAAAIAAHHDEPFSRVCSLDSLLQVSWRLVDTLGYAAFSPKKDWKWEELLEFVPNGASAWFGGSPEAARMEIDERLTSVPQ
jgi:putative nucleotidyltransferase with HDIG domain